MTQTAVQLEPRQEQGAARYDIYLQIHKGLRSFMMHTLEQLGRMDAWDECETAEVLAQLRALLGLCRLHLEKENRFLHVAMEARRPGSTAKIALEHVHHQRSIESLEAAAREVERAAGAARAEAALRLYRALALFVAENFEHMHVEESANNAVLWEDYEDDELEAIERALVASVAPEEMAAVARWMLPAMSAPERAAKLADMRPAMPPRAFAGILAMLKAQLSERDWYKLGTALGPSAA
jgi:hemerythrin-like domain-containing protein